MTCADIVNLLTKHQCADLTSSLDEATSSTYPVSTGGLGDVFAGKLLDGTPIAIKAVRPYVGHSPGTYYKRAAKEIYTWSKCKHQNVIELLGLAVFRGSIAMISRWEGNGNLSNYLSQNPSTDRCLLSRSICAGLSYLHANKIVHGDLKGANVLIDRNGAPMLTDFGNAILQDATLHFTKTASPPNISVRWTAPEILRGKSAHTTAGDIYSLGMTILEAFTSEVPFATRTDQSLYIHVVVNKKIPIRPKDVIPERSIYGNILWAVLMSCWSYEPALRPSAEIIEDALKPLTPDRLKELEEATEEKDGSDED